MITIFTTPKAWTGHIGVIQRNAIRNWKSLGYEIIMYCDDPGTKEAAKEFKVKHVPNVDKTKMGTPIIGRIFKHANKHASNDQIMYANTDIIFVRGIKETVDFVSKEFDKSLTCGSRFNLDVEKELKYNNGWEHRLECLARSNGVAHPGTGVDYFLFSKGMFNDMPDFALGRGFWDTWIIAKALKEKITVIDSTEPVFVVHQNHDYKHLPKTAPHRGKRDRWHSKGPETESNRLLRGKLNKSCADATHKITVDCTLGSLELIKN